MEGKAAKVIENAEGARTTPSVVAFTAGKIEWKGISLAAEIRMMTIFRHLKHRVESKSDFSFIVHSNTEKILEESSNFAISSSLFQKANVSLECPQRDRQ